VPSHLARRAGVLLGTGVLASAGLLGLSVGSASAVVEFGPPTACPPTAGTTDLDGNSVCVIGTSGSQAADAGGGSASFDNSALAEVIGSLGGNAGAQAARSSIHSDGNVAIAISAGGITDPFFPLGPANLGQVGASAGSFSDDAYRDSAVAVGNGDLFSDAKAGSQSGLNADNTATASAGYLSEAVAAAANGGDDNFRNAASAIAQLGGGAFAAAAGAVDDLTYPFPIIGIALDSTGNTADAAASLGGLAFANAGSGFESDFTNQHDNTAQATANLGTATALAGGFKSYEYNNSAQAGVLVGGSATATAGDCITSGCGGSNNTATASASYGGDATADVSGDTTGYAVANSAGTITSDTETDTSSTLTSTSPDAGGMGFAYDADGNWVASLNFNGTDKVFSNVGNG
jgi:hypothetical protein